MFNSKLFTIVINLLEQLVTSDIFFPFNTMLTRELFSRNTVLRLIYDYLINSTLNNRIKAEVSRCY